MIWATRSLSLPTGALAGYWSNFHDSPNLSLFLKFMAVSLLGFSAGWWTLIIKQATNGKQSR